MGITCPPLEDTSSPSNSGRSFLMVAIKLKQIYQKYINKQNSQIPCFTAVPPERNSNQGDSCLSSHFLLQIIAPFIIALVFGGHTQSQIVVPFLILEG